MRRDELDALLLQRSFQGLRLYLSNGVTYEIRHPEMAVTGRSIVFVYLPGSGGPVPVAEHRIVVSLLHIVQIEFIEAPALPSRN